MSERFHNENEFQLSIPFAILSFEESSKMDHFLNFVENKKNISRNEWEELRQHKFKLTQSEKEVKKILESQSDLDILLQNLFMKDRGLKNIASTKEEAIFVKKNEIEYKSKFSKIKEICFYANWNTQKNDWDNFQKIPFVEKESLSFFIFTEVEHKLLLAKLSLEYLENPFLKPLPKLSDSLQAIIQYLSEKTKHDQNLQTTQDMIEVEKKYTNEEALKKIALGYDVLCKYFSN